MSLISNNKLLILISISLLITILFISRQYNKTLVNNICLEILFNIKYLYINKSKILFILAISISFNLLSQIITNSSLKT